MSIIFEETTTIAGIDISRVSSGVAWGDLNGDTLPDLWVNRHWIPGILYLNQGQGTFSDATSEVFLSERVGDTHGVQWTDFDNDGDQDLVELVGSLRGTGSDPNHLYVNDDGKLHDRAEELGVDYPLSRGRTPLWFDFDNDGWLDLLAAADLRSDGQSPPTIFRQTNNAFEDVGSITGLGDNRIQYALLSDLFGNNNPELINLKRRGSKVLDLTSTPFEEITNIGSSFFSDLAIADFNGDLLPDLWGTINGINKLLADLGQYEPNSIAGKFGLRGDEKGVQFSTTGEVQFKISKNYPSSLSPSDIYIGSEGLNPNGLWFNRSTEDLDVQGILPHTPGVDRGIYIGYDPTLQQWELLFSSPEDVENFSAIIQSSEPISQFSAIGFEPDDLPQNDKLFFNNGEELVEQSEELGFNSVPTAGQSIVAGDFDNDMDVDAYIVATATATNRPNVLYENQGDGTFIAVENAGGARGTNLGIGESVTTVDYDLDGFLDLFVANGKEPLLFALDAPYQLFRNQGNENHWLQIDLEGIVSNRDGIGAKVFATAGGITQLREQSGGIHNKVQNHQRIHFGLAEYTTVEELVIEWPSGMVQKLHDIPADQLIRIIEPSGSFIPGQPTYQVGAEARVFLWKEFFDAPYHLRTVGAVDPTEFAVNLIANDTLLDVTPVKLETNDILDVTEFGFSLTSKLVGYQDGIDFYLKPGAKALLSVTQNEVANPRQVNVGQQKARLSPVGWILSSDEFPDRPAFSPGNDLGLFLGQGASEDRLEFRWNGDSNWHETRLSVLAADEISSFSPINLEPNDKFTTFSNGIEIQGQVGTWYDGLDITTTEPTKIGFTYEQDGLFQPHRVNLLEDDFLGLPNAYQVPLATPYGRPEYNPSVDEGIFLWLDEEDFWHLRMTGSEEGSRYVGSIVSDRAAIDVQTVNLEKTDVVNTTDPSRIDFDFRVWQSWEDGIDFRFPAGSALTLNLEKPSEAATDLLHIGTEQWPISELPLDLSGW